MKPNCKSNSKMYSLKLRRTQSAILAPPLFIVIFTFLAVPLCLGQSAGALDTSFNGNGRVVSTFSALDSLYGMASQSDGRLVTVGRSESGTGNGNMGLARFDADGSLDQSFGDNGRVMPTIGPSGILHAVAIQADGKIVAAGVSGSGFDKRFAIIRLNPDGSFDNNFNEVGSKIITSQVGVAYSVMIQDDGKLVIVGVTGNSTDDFAVVRLNEDGSFDTSFNGTGIARISIGPGIHDTSYVFAGLLQSDGKIVVGGTIFNTGGTLPLALVRFKQDGSQDMGFGDGGSTIVELSAPVFHLGGMSEQADGKIVVAGTSSGFNSGFDFAVIRFSSDGALDTSFGEQGKVVTSTSSGGEEVNALTINGDGNIIAAGCREDVLNSGSKHHTLVQYDSNGMLDPAFGNGGILRESISANQDCARSLLTGSDNKIKVGGYRNEADSDFSILALNADGSRDQMFSSDGLISAYLGVAKFRNERVNALAVQQDGKTVAVSYDSTLGNLFAFVRFNCDGSIDPSFDGDGKVALLPPSGSGVQNDGSANAISIQPDGKIVAAGNAIDRSANRADIILMRLLPDGSPDPSFGINGVVATRPSQSRTTIRGLAIQSDGRIVVAGEVGPGSSSSTFIVVRYMPNGSLDSTFGTGGIVITQFQTKDGAYSVVLQMDGRIVVSGYSTPGTGGFPIGAMERLNDNGTLDSSFGQGGKLLTGIRFISSAIQPDGKILLLPDVSPFSVGRVNADGSWDQTFGDGGGFVDTAVGFSSKATSIVLEGDGKILLAGYSKANQLGYDDFTIVRYTNKGQLDFSFDGDGIVVTPVSNLADRAYAVAMQPDGRIVVGGNSFSNETMDDIAVARYFSGFYPSTPSTALFDFDADGRSDISVFRPTSGAWYLQRSRDGLYGTEFGYGDDKIAPADYDGDGKTDIAVYRPSTGVWYIFNSSDGNVRYEVFGIAEDRPTPADYDGDGKADISVFRPSTGTWYRQNSSDGSFFGMQFGTSEDKPTLGDFDGDGKADIAVFRPSSGAWYQVNSSDGTLFGELFGFGTDVTVPADYDGDGKTDLAVFRPSNGFWYIKNSNGAVYTAYPFGLTDDIPAPGDFDGDGKTDLSVFRPSDGNWYRLNSSDGSFFAYQFGTAGDVPTQVAFQYR